MIHISELKKTYKSFSLDVTLDVKPGCITGLVGRNGAGKSTTIKSILGLVIPDSGTCSVFGKKSTELTGEEKEKIGAALSDSGFSSYLSLKDIRMILKNMYHNFDIDFFNNMCKRYELPETLRIQKYSTGMKAKLKVLIALSHKADLLILDEPTSGLDVIVRNEILDMLRDYMAENENRSMIISSHIASDLEGLCDDIYMIHRGKVVFHEDTDVILSDYAVLKMDEKQFENVEKEYIIKFRKEKYGYMCLTNQKQFFAENYPQITLEKGGIDELIIMTGEE